jgi:hypothetical protein
MSKFVANPTHFAAECVRENGQCVVARENFVFLDDGNELAAIGELQSKCGHIVLIPDQSDKGHTWLYHTSCDRMTDVINQIFEDNLKAPSSLPQSASEMTVGELQRRCVTIPLGACRARVDRFDFQRPS